MRFLASLLNAITLFLLEGVFSVDLEIVLEVVRPIESKFQLSLSFFARLSARFHSNAMAFVSSLMIVVG